MVVYLRMTGPIFERKRMGCRFLHRRGRIGYLLLDSWNETLPIFRLNGRLLHQCTVRYNYTLYMSASLPVHHSLWQLSARVVPTRFAKHQGLSRALRAGRQRCSRPVHVSLRTSRGP